MGSIAAFVRLTELVAPPDWPTRANGDWKRFASVNGFPPPEDYRMMIREYGAGSFADWLDVIEPFNPAWTFIDKVSKECRRLQEERLRSSANQPNWPLWPDPGGFLPWATTASGDHVGWRTVGNREMWTVQFWAAGGAGSCSFGVGTIDFILGLIDGNLGEPAFDQARDNPFRAKGAPFLPAAEDDYSMP